MKSIFFLSLFMVSSIAAAKSVIIDVSLDPSGWFKIESDKIVGKLFYKDTKFSGDYIMVPFSSFTTGDKKRDKEILSRLKHTAGPSIEIRNFRTHKGKAKATIVIQHVKKDIEIAYTRFEDSYLKTWFELDLKDFHIHGLNEKKHPVVKRLKITAVMPYQKL